MRKRRLAMLALGVFVSPLGLTVLHAQKIYTNAKPMTFAHNLAVLYRMQKINLTAFADAVPEDKFYAPPPAYQANGGKLADIDGDPEQSSIGAELAHGIDSQERMCTLILTGKRLTGSQLPGTAVLKSEHPTKAAMMAALAHSFKTCDPIIENFKDANVSAMVMSQHALEPLGTVIFNNIAHDREIFGRVATWEAAWGIKMPKEINAADPENPQNLYYCAGAESKTDELCK